MAKEVDVIFTEDKKGFFKIGQRKRVKLGYARNYLLPQGYAALATSINDSELKSIETRANNRLAELKKRADEIAPILNGQTLEFEVQTHDEGLLYGAVHPQDVVEKINIQLEVQLDKYDLRMPNQIKEVCELEVPIDLHSDVPIEIKIVVKSENEDLSEEALQAKADALAEARIARAKAEAAEAGEEYIDESEAAEATEEASLTEVETQEADAEA